MTSLQKQLMLDIFQSLIWAVSDLNQHGAGGVSDIEMRKIDDSFEKLVLLMREE